MKRTFVAALATGAALMAATAAWAQTYPTKLVRIVVGTTAGSSMDIVARDVAERFNKVWGSPVIVEDRPGAAGLIAAELVAKAAPDGYTLLFCPGSLAASPVVNRKLPFDVMRDFEPVTKVVSRSEVLVVNPHFPVTTVRQLVALAKSKPGDIRFATGGVGSASQMGMELFNLMAGIKMTHIAYKGGPPALSDVISGQIEAYFGGALVALPMIKAGKVRALGTSGPKRTAFLPDVPTMAEGGVPGYEFDNWNGLFATGGTPAAIVEKIAAEVGRMARTPEAQERFSLQGIELVSSTPAEFKAFFNAEVRKWPPVVKAANIGAE